MRLEIVLVLVLMTGAPLAGCLDGGEDLEETSSPKANDSDDGSGEAGGEVSSSSATDGNQTGEEAEDERIEDDGGQAGDENDTDASKQDGDEGLQSLPTAVVAHIDTGINPYHEAFREDSKLAYTHPSEYIEDFPEDAQALELSLDASSYEKAVEQDADVWSNVTEGELYWIPGTRIVGAISFEAGGTNEGREETRILDDFGHGTMTASRALGEGTSLAPDARLVTIEGLGGEQVRWAADAGWIDVQTNSWIDLVPPPANQLQNEIPETNIESTSEAFAEAAEQMVTIAASGNGAAYTAGFAPTPTFTLSTAPDGVVLVGAHDNGYLTPWSGSPPHLVADGFRPMAAVVDSMSDVEAHGLSCCTSAAAPYAAGAAANLIVQAREILDDTSVGIEDGIVAEGPEDVVIDGPLKDGEFTLEELHDVLFHTAQERPQPTHHDGDIHWAAEPDEEQPEDPTDPGENAYCPGCWSTPVRYEEIPEEVPTYLSTGYGAVNIYSDEDALAVLLGAMESPDREEADEFYAADQQAREAYYP